VTAAGKGAGRRCCASGPCTEASSSPGRRGKDGTELLLQLLLPAAAPATPGAVTPAAPAAGGQRLPLLLLPVAAEVPAASRRLLPKL
jgi:hypothetical protein